MNMKGSKTTASSKILENFVSPFNATVTEKLLGNLVPIVGKANLDELCVNFSSKDRNRFLNEFAKAKAAGFKIHLVVESNDYHDLLVGNYRSQFHANTLEANIWSIQAKYDVRVSYVKDRNDAPRFITNCLKTQLTAELKNWY